MIPMLSPLINSIIHLSPSTDEIKPTMSLSLSFICHIKSRSSLTLIFQKRIRSQKSFSLSLSPLLLLLFLKISLDSLSFSNYVSSSLSQFPSLSLSFPLICSQHQSLTSPLTPLAPSLLNSARQPPPQQRTLPSASAPTRSFWSPLHPSIISAPQLPSAYNRHLSNAISTITFRPPPSFTDRVSSILTPLSDLPYQRHILRPHSALHQPAAVHAQPLHTPPSPHPRKLRASNLPPDPRSARPHDLQPSACKQPRSPSAFSPSNPCTRQAPRHPQSSRN